jgi:excisionase family DNA binding protein
MQQDGSGALTIQEFCARYSVPRSTFYERLDRGEIVARKHGRRVLIAVADAERWFNSLPKVEAKAPADISGIRINVAG